MKKLNRLHKYFCFSFLWNYKGNSKAKLETNLTTNEYMKVFGLKPNYFKKQGFLSSFSLPKVIIEVQSGNGVLNRLVPYI